MRTKVTLILIFLNVALFFFIFKFERGWRTERASLEARRRVLGAESANIQSLTLSGPALPAEISLARRPDGWYLTKPFDWPANPHAVNRIIGDLERLEHETSFSVRDLAKNNQSLADYGLDKPGLTVTFSSADQAEPKMPGGGPAAVSYTLRLGDKTKDGNRLYVLSPDGERVHVVGNSLAESLTQPLEELRSDTIFSIPVYEVRSFNLQPAAPANLRIRLHSDGSRWTFEAPIQARANKTATVLAINGLNALRVKSFITTPPPDVISAASPTLRITLEGNNRSETLYLGAPVATAAPAAPPPDESEYYARMEGKDALFTVVIRADLKKQLDNAQKELRERRLLEFDARAVTAITLAAPNAPELTLQRDPVAPDAPWQIVRRGAAAGPTQSADAKVIQHLLEQLALLSAQEFLSDAPTRPDLENWGFNNPARTITLTLAGGPAPAATTTLKLEIGTGLDRGTRARVSGAEYVYDVDAGILRDTPVASLVYRERLLRELPAGAQITAVRLTDAATKEVLFAQTLPAAGANAPPPAAALTSLLAQLRVLRAKAFVEDRFTPAVSVAGEDRPWKYQLEATITLVGGATGPQTSTTTLLLTERLGGNTQLAGSPEFGAVWELEQPFIDALGSLIPAPHEAAPPAAPPGAVPAAPTQAPPAPAPPTSGATPPAA